MRFARRMVAAVAAVALAASAWGVPTTAQADGWDFVYGDPGPANYSRYQAVRSAPSGESYLAGFFTGSFHGLTATDVYRSFVQRIDADGTIAWTVFGGSDTFTTIPATPDLLRDGNGNLFFRNTAGGAGWTALSPAGAVIGTTSAQSADSAAARPIAVQAGGILQVPFNNLHKVERRDSGLNVLWSFDHSAYFDSIRPPDIAEAPDGTFWLVGTKLRTLPTQQDSISMVHLDATGQLISSIRHFGVITADPNQAPRDGRILTVGDGFLWVNALEVQPVTSSNSAFPYVKAIWSFATDDGRKLGVVSNTVAREHVPSGSQMLDCFNMDLTTTYESTTGSGLRTRQVVMQGSRIVVLANCSEYVPVPAGTPPASNGEYTPVLLVYAADGPLGSNMRRISARVVAPGTTISAIDADDSGNVTAAGSTTQGVVFSGPIEGHQEDATSPERAVALRNPTGNISALPDFRPLTPARLFDTRPSEPQGLVSVVKQKYGPGTLLTVKVAGAGGVPAGGVAAVSLNVTATEPDGSGFVTVYPCGDRPGASSLNFVTGQTVPNAVVAPVSAGGEVCFYANANTHLLADVNGWFATGSSLNALTPTRLFDTRPAEGHGAVAVPKAKVGGAVELRVKVAGAAGVPANGVGAVSLNVTATEPD
ncbi:MAG: hypothetical protein KDB40_00120, partial [Acidimicrobiales bacterium]|nr:hypothetical protein [Acidimicrobiales bacterium]